MSAYLSRAQREQSIRDHLAAGLSVSETMRRTGCGRGMVVAVANGMPAESKGVGAAVKP